MDIEDFFEEWDEDKDDNDLAELLEDNVRAVTRLRQKTVKTKMKARAKMMAVRLSAASVKSGIT